MRQHADVDERDVALAPLDFTQIRAGKAALESKTFLRPAAHLAKLDQAFSKQ